MTTRSPRPTQRQHRPAQAPSLLSRWLLATARMASGAALWTLGLAWLIPSAIALGAAGTGQAHAQSTLGLQHGFVVTSRKGLNNNFSVIAGTLSLQNLSSQTVTGPVTLVLENLDPAISLNEASGGASSGRPYINLPASIRFAPREPVVLNLSFKVPRSMESLPTISLTARLTQIRSQAAPAAASLLGPDLNGNGIRDDLEPIIEARYRNQPQLLAAAKQQLRAMQMGLVATGNADQAFDAVLVLNRSIDCILQMEGIEKGATEVQFLRDASLNSKERVLAWIKSGDLLAGKFAPGSGPAPCDK